MGTESACEVKENVTCLAPEDNCLKIHMCLFFLFGLVFCFLFFSHASPQFGKSCC